MVKKIIFDPIDELLDLKCVSTKVCFLTVVIYSCSKIWMSVEMFTCCFDEF